MLQPAKCLGAVLCVRNGLEVRSRAGYQQSDCVPSGGEIRPSEVLASQRSEVEDDEVRSRCREAQTPGKAILKGSERWMARLARHDQLAGDDSVRRQLCGRL